MEFVSNILKNVNSAIVLNGIGLVIFITFFIVVIVRTYRLPKADVEKIKKSILEN